MLKPCVQEMNQDERLGLPRRSHTLDSLEALTVDYNQDTEELVVAYVQDEDPNKTLDSLVKNIDLTVAEVRFTADLVQLNVEVALLVSAKCSR